MFKQLLEHWLPYANSYLRMGKKKTEENSLTKVIKILIGLEHMLFKYLLNNQQTTSKTKYTLVCKLI